MALILRNGGSQSPDRWLRESRNNHDYSVFLCFLSKEDTFMCVYLKETSIGQALDDYLSSLSEEEAVYTKKEARQILLGLLEQL